MPGFGKPFAYISTILHSWLTARQARAGGRRGVDFARIIGKGRAPKKGGGMDILHRDRRASAWGKGPAARCAAAQQAAA
jgi:hypothetical protein